MIIIIIILDFKVYKVWLIYFSMSNNFTEKISEDQSVNQRQIEDLLQENERLREELTRAQEQNRVTASIERPMEEHKQSAEIHRPIIGPLIEERNKSDEIQERGRDTIQGKGR
jgi:hypothetical protein